jgi:hypothetical protein
LAGRFAVRMMNGFANIAGCWCNRVSTVTNS